MRTRTALLTALLLLVAVPACTLFNKDDEGTGTIYGLFVGISQYADPSIPDLSVSHRDAINLAGRLVGFSGSWDPGRMITLTNGAATKGAIKGALQDLLGRAGSSDTVLFFYSGHGFSGGDTGKADEWDNADEYISPTDSINAPGNYANDISDDELESWLSSFGGRKVVIIDACFSGGFIPGQGGGPAVQAKSYLKGGVIPKASQRVPMRSYFQDLTGGSTVVMTAAREDQLSWESGALGHSIFTWYLIEGLGGPADGNANGNYSALELFTYAVDRTSAIAPLPQNPVLRGPASDTLIAW
jgi:hypothetical protein